MKFYKMKEYDLKQLFENSTLLNGKIQEFLLKKILLEQKEDKSEIHGHLFSLNNKKL